MPEGIQISIKGDVQGVGFRAAAYRLAKKLGLKGYVENLQDGSVKVCIQAEEDEAIKLINLLKKEFPGMINSISIDIVPLSESFHSFSIRL